MEALASFFAFGTVMYFVFTAVWVVLLFYWVEKECIVLSGFNILLYFLFLEFLVKKDVFSGIVQHPGRSLLIILGYLLLGFVWSFVKWWLFVNKAAIRYKEDRFEWLTKQAESRRGRVSIDGLDNITLETMVPYALMDDWRGHVGYGDKVPKAIKHKKTISHWVLYWPISALWSLLDDFLGKVTRVIIVKFRFIYDSITKNAFKNVEKLDS